MHVRASCIKFPILKKLVNLLLPESVVFWFPGWEVGGNYTIFNGDLREGANPQEKKKPFSPWRKNKKLYAQLQITGMYTCQHLGMLK